MAQQATVRIDVAGVRLAEAPEGQPVTLAETGGVQVLVLLRHRH